MIARRRSASLIKGLVAAAAIVGSLAVAPAPASAEGRATTRHAVAAGECYETWLGYGYFGKLRCGTVPIDCDWDGDGWYDESFGIAPDRSIWHVWPNSGGWKRMPNNGWADHTYNCYRNGNGQRQVEVRVTGNGIWYSHYSGGWRGWYKH